MPCYNEELNIGALIDEWMNESAKLEEEGCYLIVCPIDDKSTDNTQAKMREKAALYGEDRINIIAHEQLLMKSDSNCDMIRNRATVKCACHPL